ncbi:MAG: HlyD family type I secretion periplasmic adaptor subunit [Hyphomonadaceae bacterium]|nr:HlyD family type I secretion periplasmic adaptor subunit [Hyphomonadaceae bacterium]
MADRGFRNAMPLFTLGWSVIGLVFGGLLAWSYLAPFEGAVLATGTITVEGHHKAVQHLDGGVVSEIFVDEGDLVSQGDVLVELDDRESIAALAALNARLQELLAAEIRLNAEAGGANAMPLPNAASGLIDDLATSEAYASQAQLFDVRRANRRTQASIFNERVDQLRRRIDGLEADIESRHVQAELLELEIEGLSDLLEKGLVPKPRVLSLQRQQAEVSGAIEVNRAEIARLKVEIGETRLQLLQIEDDFRQEVAEQLSDTKTEIAELVEQRTVLQIGRERLSIRAPHAGRVLGVQAHTIGGVIAPIDAIMYIVPQDKGLVASVQILPQDVDRIAENQTAVLRFSAFSRGITPEMNGTVIKVSADTIADPESGFEFYQAVIEFETEGNFPDEFELLPGMPVDVSINTGQRSVLSYLLRPAQDAMAKSFRD